MVVQCRVARDERVDVGDRDQQAIEAVSAVAADLELIEIARSRTASIGTSPRRAASATASGGKSGSRPCSTMARRAIASRTERWLGMPLDRMDCMVRMNRINGILQRRR
jgi:hypothetical protein